MRPSRMAMPSIVASWLWAIASGGSWISEEEVAVRQRQVLSRATYGSMFYYVCSR